MNERLYKIVRFRQSGTSTTRNMPKNLTLKQAQEHCSDPETSSKTAKRGCNGNDARIARWSEKGKHWFDGYTEQ